VKTRYAKHVSKKKTSQREAIPGSKQVQNNAGGFAWSINAWDRFNRWLVLGSEGGTYYVREHELTVANAKNVQACIDEDGKKAVDLIVEISDKGRAPKNDPAIFALALAASAKDPKTAAYALANLGKVCRIGTHLFHFVDALQEFRGYGRAVKKALAKWYTSRDDKDLEYQLAKYQSRDDWSNRDVIRLAHPTPKNDFQKAVFNWVTQKDGAEKPKYAPIKEPQTPLFAAMEQLKKIKDVKEAIKVIVDNRLAWEMIPTEFQAKAEVWEALLPNLPMTATIRNLGRMSANGLLVKGNRDAIKLVTDRITDKDALKKARVHPIALLSALRVYQSGHGARGKGEWDVVEKIVDALDEAFYLSFDNVEPSGKSILIGLDVSGSMDGGEIAGVPGLTPRDAACAMAMVTVRTEKNCEVCAFSSGFQAFDISPKMRLDAVIKKAQGLSFEGTDCAVPMLWATRKKVKFDAFCIYTDSETWAGNVHPTQALVQYRKTMGIPTSKLVVVGVTATEFSIADSNDKGMLDVVGFDTAAPQVISGFIRD
jgi:60 kDa SS-A/Ro ribonucleoprotein